MDLPLCRLRDFRMIGKRTVLQGAAAAITAPRWIFLSRPTQPREYQTMALPDESKTS